MVASPYPSNWISTWSWQGQPVGVVAAPAQEQAEAAPVVLIHGFGACKEHWRHNVETLRRERAVYALDLIGFGASGKPRARLADEPEASGSPVHGLGLCGQQGADVEPSQGKGAVR